MNINEPISNPKLVNAIDGLSNDNVTQQKFFEEFAQAKLLCPADIQLQNSSRDGNEIVVGEGTSISIKHLEDTKGNKFLICCERCVIFMKLKKASSDTVKLCETVRRRITIGHNSKLKSRLTPIRRRDIVCNCMLLSA